MEKSTNLIADILLFAVSLVMICTITGVVAYGQGKSAGKHYMDVWYKQFLIDHNIKVEEEFVDQYGTTHQIVPKNSKGEYKP